MTTSPPEVDLGPIVDRATHARSESTRGRWLKRGVLLSLIVSLSSFAWAVSVSLQRADTADQKAQTATAQKKVASAGAQTNRDAATTIADEVLRACNTPGPTARALRKRGLCSTAVSTKQIVTKPAASSSSAAPRISQGQIEGAVAAYCERTSGCRNGRDATPAQVVAAVTAYCDAQGQCKGPNGADSTVPGPAGSSPTSDQIADSLATYCAAHGECRGPAGADGGTGPPGAPGDPGAAAYPFQFTFTVPGMLGAADQTYTCSVSSPTDLGTCSSS